MALIYIVEDDESIREIETIALKNSGHMVGAFGSSKEFFKKLDEILPDLVLLDVMLPDESGSDYKVYKNTLVKRAVNSLDIKLDEFLEGPSAISFSSDELAPVKVISEFAKKHTNLELKAGIVEGKVAEASELAKYAAIPSREGLLTMLAAGLMGTVKDLSICLDLYAKQKEEN